MASRYRVRFVVEFDITVKDPSELKQVIRRVTPNVGFDMYPAGKMRGIPTEVHDETLVTKFDTIVREETNAD